MSQNPHGGNFPFHILQIPAFPQQTQQPIRSDEAPARVRAAMHFFDQVTGKTAGTVAVGSVGSPEKFDGQSLTVDEENALSAAADLLEKYFRGKMPPTEQEKKVDGTWNGMFGMPMKCYFCFDARDEQNWPKQGCPLCRGCGQLMIFPLINKEGR